MKVGYYTYNGTGEVFFAAILLSDLLPLRPDVICGLMVVGCLVIATVMVLIEAARDEP